MPLSSVVLTGKRVVIVEDEAIIQLQLNRTLTEYGLVVVGQARNAEDGVEITLREKPDLVTMDITMGKMDGIEATRRIMEQLPTCIVVMTAYDRGGIREAALAAGASGYIVKPFLASLAIPQVEAFYLAWISRDLPRT